MGLVKILNPKLDEGDFGKGIFVNFKLK